MIVKTFWGLASVLLELWIFETCLPPADQKSPTESDDEQKEGGNLVQSLA